jgi:hypothetical protein
VVALTLVIVVAVVVPLVLLFGTQTGCFNPGVSCPATEDIVNGPIIVNASQSNFYQFIVPYGAQDLDVHIQWSDGGGISVYVVNATELISWQAGHGLSSFYDSGQSTQGDVNLQVPTGDLYYLVFDNTLSTVQRSVQTSSGFSFMCPGLSCGSGPISQGNPSYPSCVSSNGSEVCSVTLVNSGSETSPTGTCIESWSLDEGPLQTWGAPRVGTFSPTMPFSHSATVTGTCTVTETTAPLGLAITVLIPFSNDENVVMYGPVSLNAPACTQSGTHLVCTFSINNDAMPGVVATKCQIEIGDNVTSWTGTVGGVTVFNSANHGGLFTCSVVGTEPTLGTPVTGIVRFSNGSYAPFSSEWS